MPFRRRIRLSDFPERPENIHRCLLVANDCSPTPSLCQLMADRCGHGPCEMHVLVSRCRRAVLVSDPALRPRGAGADAPIKIDDQAWDVAEARLDSFMRALGDLGQPLTGQILPGNLVRQLRRILRWDDFDEVVVMATQNERRRISRDLPTRIRRLTKVPVTTVVADGLAL